MDDLRTLATVLAKPEPSAEVIERSRRRLQHRIRGPVRAHRRPSLLIAGLGLTAAAATAAVVIVSGTTAPTATPNSPPAAAQLSARDVLLAAAATAERVPEGTGAYWHVRTDTREGSPFESWTSRDGRTWFRGAKTKGEVVEIRRPVPFRLGGPDVTFEQLEGLPTEPDALKAWIAGNLERSDVRTSAGRPDAAMREQFVFDGLISLVCQLPAPPEVRAAAFRAIAAYPNVESLGAVEGGQGLRITLPEGSQVRQARLVVDPESSQVRDANFFVTTDGGVAWVPDGSAKLLAGWTDELPE
ncbi:CU044_5270 family protein [Nonomuraea africana]|uniref:CU044_5270 family protein n=1 Tax=Nonomuraea africana TaxID=46171 RepID=A0ABR9KJR7_9ACTN|nr:CU044_5270 family protein [Nonomuraea africana]MBE1561792.1 hypothetical protein [Nonomuraea africana]